MTPAISIPRLQSSWGQHGAHLGPVGPRRVSCWSHEPCYQGLCCANILNNLPQEANERIISAWMNGYTHLKLWLNYKGATVGVYEWISNSIPHFTRHGITWQVNPLDIFSRDNFPDQNFAKQIFFCQVLVHHWAGQDDKRVKICIIDDFISTKCTSISLPKVRAD